MEFNIMLLNSTKLFNAELPTFKDCSSIIIREF
ncbi:hypothetical protein CLV32_4633 [Pedobacter duraquae]|uniref:Uncharacterized protein n=1 Tax=Pedobacter duraquae TaxID=425511 RepID=A0A4R6IBR0_9SPHI|nr:hypothetical protein CLV32_4633 [Pedobacter duraquae]